MDAGCITYAHFLRTAPPLNPAIKTHLTRDGTIGHGGIHGMQPPNNPLVFILQLVLGLLLHVGPSSGPPVRIGATIGVNATSVCAQGSLSVKLWDSVLGCSSSTCMDAGCIRYAHFLRTAPLLNPAIKAHLTRDGTIGHGGTHGMQPPNNPLVFILQLVLGLLLHVGPSSGPPVRIGATIGVNATSVCAQDSLPVKLWDSVLGRSSSTCMDAGSFSDCCSTSVRVLGHQ
ncbi:hypothetical protein MRX96_011087 [Rhipicephalus microplus]